MKLAFVYFDINNVNFRKDLVRYNHLLKNYFEHEDSTIVKKLSETFESLLQNSLSHDILTEKETEIYNVIIDFMANEVDEDELKNIQSQVYDETIKEKVVGKMKNELPDVDPETLQNVMEKSNKMINIGGNQNIEIVFIPSVLNV